MEDDRERLRGKVDVLVVERDEKGNEFQRVNDTIEMNLKQSAYEQLLKSGVPYHHSIAVDAQAAYVRVVARDCGTGNIGSLTIPLRNLPARQTALPAK